MVHRAFSLFVGNIEVEPVINNIYIYTIILRINITSCEQIKNSNRNLYKTLAGERNYNKKRTNRRCNKKILQNTVKTTKPS